MKKIGGKILFFLTFKSKTNGLLVNTKHLLVFKLQLISAARTPLKQFFDGPLHYYKELVLHEL